MSRQLGREMPNLHPYLTLSHGRWETRIEHDGSRLPHFRRSQDRIALCGAPMPAPRPGRKLTPTQPPCPRCLKDGAPQPKG